MITHNFCIATISKSKEISYKFASKEMLNVLGLVFWSDNISVFISCKQGDTKREYCLVVYTLSLIDEV